MGARTSSVHRSTANANQQDRALLVSETYHILFCRLSSASMLVVFTRDVDESINVVRVMADEQSEVLCKLERPVERCEIGYRWVRRTRREVLPAT